MIAAPGDRSRAEVLIIGGGLIGCAAAWHLARRGASVLLLEAGEINAGASGQNAGSLHFQIERRFLEGGESLLDQAAQIVALNRLAVEDWRGIEAELCTDLHVKMAGGLMVAETEAEAALLERKAAREQSFGLRSELVDGDEARRIAPYLSENISAASFAPDEGHADPRAVTPAFAKAAAAAGARIETGARASSIQRSHGGFSVSWTAGERTVTTICERILVAAGAWTPEVAALANLHVPLFPVALLMNASERTKPFLPHLIQHVGQRLSMKQTYAGNILIGGGWPSRLAAAPDGRHDLARRSSLIEASLLGNLAVAARTVPVLRNLNLIRSWTGMTTISADQLPIVGEVPRLPGFFVAAGGSAFTLGLTFARLLAEAMSGQKDERLEIVSPGRFEHLNSFMGLS